jgi:hypothetical protein
MRSLIYMYCKYINFAIPWHPLKHILPFINKFNNQIFMKNLYIAIVAIAFALSMTSCASYRMQTYDYMYINKQGVIQKPVVAELDVKNQKSSLSKTYNNISVQEAKENAMVDLISENKADLLVHPMYRVEATNRVIFSTDKWSTVKVDLSGYPASYKNMRTYQAADSTSFKVNAQINNNLNKPQESINEKKSSLLKKIATYGAAALVVFTLLGGL